MRTQDLDAAEDRIRKEIDLGTALVNDLREWADDVENGFSGHREVDRKIAGLHTCYAPTALFSSGYPRCFFVREYSLDVSGCLVGVSGIIVESIVRDSEWHKPFPTDRPGVVTMRSMPVPAAEIVRTTAGLYADGKVRLGEFSDVCREPCLVCGKGALVVCTHAFDYEDDRQKIEVFRLCLECPRADFVAEASRLDAHAPHPTLPPKG